MKNRLWALVVAVLVWGLAACQPAASPGPTAQTTEPAKPALLYVFNNASPHISVIDAATNEVTRTGDVPGFKSWTWNDDNNYFDGKNLWLGVRDTDTNDVEVILLDLETLQVTQRIPLGQDRTTLYIGKATKSGLLYVSKHASGQVAIIDTKTRQVLEIKDVPVSGGVACDMDVVTGPDGVERVYIPTDNGNTVLALDAATRQIVQTLKVGEPVAGNDAATIRPFMLTASPDGRYVWVQERSTAGNAILDARTLEVVRRVPTGRGAIMNTFSPDGRFSYTGHSSDTKVVVQDATTFAVVREIEVGANPQKVAVHPNGRTIYAIVTRENAVAVIDTATWQVTNRIDLGAAPSGIFFRPL